MLAGAMSDDRTLFLAWCEGDTAAGATLFDRHYDAVARFFHNKVADGVAADLIQNTFLALVSARERFRGDSSFRTFVFAVARNLLHKHYRTLQGPAARVDFGEVSVAALGPTASDAMHLQQEQRLLLAALRQIPIECQEVLELLYWEQLSTAEIAEITGAPVGTVKTRLHRGRRLLEAQMRALAEHPSLAESTVADFERWAASLRARLGRGAPEDA